MPKATKVTQALRRTVNDKVRAMHAFSSEIDAMRALVEVAADAIGGHDLVAAIHRMRQVSCMADNAARQIEWLAAQASGSVSALGEIKRQRPVSNARQHKAKTATAKAAATMRRRWPKKLPVKWSSPAPAR